MLLNFNPHRRSDFYYNIPFKRKYFSTIIQHLDHKFITQLIGLRRVGKTTLLKQTIDYLIQKKHIPRNHILYYTFDIPAEPRQIIEEFVHIHNHNLLDTNKKFFVFFDEIQKVPDWQSKIKVYYDLYPNIKFILSGSSSLFLQKRESLA